MRLKAKHLRHPLRTIEKAKFLAKTYFDVKSFPYRSRLRFREDSRYQLQNLTAGFASRIDDSSADQELLERICSAYIRATEDQKTAPENFQPSKWWDTHSQQTRLQPVMQALEKRDIPALRRMYSNFYRDPCSSGLLPVRGLPWNLRDGAMKDTDRYSYLGDSLYSIDYWTERTARRFALADLAGPNIGNPFGVMLDGTLVRFEAPYQHYCAHRLSTILGAGPSAVAEIGGGFGGMAYFLLRDRQPLTYFDFDLPETIALASYFLMKAFPSLTFLLYGEKRMTQEEIARANVVLMPLFEIEQMPPRSVDFTFSSHALSSLPSELMAHDLDRIGRITQGHFLHISGMPGTTALFEQVSRRRDMQLVEAGVSGWNGHKTTNWNGVEALYRVGEAKYDGVKPQRI
jgi:putative sugar O-methyltransferase